MTPIRHRITSVAVVVVDAVLLRADWVSPSELVSHLAHPRPWVDAVGSDAAALELARAGLWLAAFWLALAVTVVLVSVLPGTLGRAAGALGARVAPAVLRRTIAAALGASVVLVPVAAGASPTPGGGTTPAGAPVVATAASAAHPNAQRLSGGWPWPTSAPTTPPSVTPSTAPAQPVPWPNSARPTPSAPARSSSDVVVTAGDCLWAIAAHRLGPAAGAHRIAIETRRWYAANAATIGPDPGLIQPGQHLHPPTQKGH